MSGNIKDLIAYAREKLELKERDSEYKANRLLVYDETKALYNSGKYVDIHTAMQEELGSICYRILENTAVFKEEEDLHNFLREAGFEI